eukprot:3403363-Amphidinium_carterae.1
MRERCAGASSFGRSVEDHRACCARVRLRSSSASLEAYAAAGIESLGGHSNSRRSMLCAWQYSYTS